MNMKSKHSVSGARDTADIASFEDVSTWARRAGIEYPTLIEPQLRAMFEALAPAPIDPLEPHVPLFHLLVPLRFVLSRRPSDCRFQVVVGKKWHSGGIEVRVEFRCDGELGDLIALFHASRGAP